MKIVKDFTTAKGVRRVTVELAEGEKLVAVRESSHYRLGYPIEDVVPSHVLSNAGPVVWDPCSQKWIE